MFQVINSRGLQPESNDKKPFYDKIKIIFGKIFFNWTRIKNWSILIIYSDLGKNKYSRVFNTNKANALFERPEIGKVHSI